MRPASLRKYHVKLSRGAAITSTLTPYNTYQDEISETLQLKQLLLRNLPYPHRKRCALFTGYFRAGQDRDMPVQLRFRPIHKFKGKVSDENGQNSLQ